MKGYQTISSIVMFKFRLVGLCTKAEAATQIIDRRQNHTDVS
jgi:hypothetical protein